MAKYLLQEWNGHFKNVFSRQIHLHPTNQSDQCQGLTTINVLCLMYVCDAGPIAIDSMLITAVSRLPYYRHLWLHAYHCCLPCNIQNGDGGCGWQQPTGGLTTQVVWLSLRVGGCGHPALSLHTSNDLKKLSQWLWPSRDHNKHRRGIIIKHH